MFLFIPKSKLQVYSCKLKQSLAKSEVIASIAFPDQVNDFSTQVRQRKSSSSNVGDRNSSSTYANQVNFLCGNFTCVNVNLLCVVLTWFE